MEHTGYTTELVELPMGDRAGQLRKIAARALPATLFAFAVLVALQMILRYPDGHPVFTALYKVLLLVVLALFVSLFFLPGQPRQRVFCFDGGVLYYTWRVRKKSKTGRYWQNYYLIRRVYSHRMEGKEIVITGDIGHIAVPAGTRQPTPIHVDPASGAFALSGDPALPPSSCASVSIQRLFRDEERFWDAVRRISPQQAGLY